MTTELWQNLQMPELVFFSDENLYTARFDLQLRAREKRDSVPHLKYQDNSSKLYSNPVHIAIFDFSLPILQIQMLKQFSQIALLRAASAA